MSAPDLKLVEICDPPVVGNTLHVERYLGDRAAVFLCIAGTDEDPATKGRAMELKREAVAQLRDWLNTVLESAAS
jgi:hypothetical protein